MALSREQKRDEAMNRAYTTDKRVYRRMPDGRLELVAVANQGLTYARARSVGLLDKDGNENPMEQQKDGTYLLTAPEPETYFSSVAHNRRTEMDPRTGLPVDHDRTNYGGTIEELTRAGADVGNELLVDARGNSTASTDAAEKPSKPAKPAK